MDSIPMSDLNFVIQRIDAGDKVRFFEDFYGKQWIEIKRVWQFWRKRRMYFRNDEIEQIKKALLRRRRQRTTEPSLAAQ